MNLTVYLNNGMTFNLTNVEGYDPQTFTDAMNDGKILAINLGNIIVNKHTIMMVVPTENIPKQGGGKNELGSVL